MQPIAHDRPGVRPLFYVQLLDEPSPHCASIDIKRNTSKQLRSWYVCEAHPFLVEQITNFPLSFVLSRFLVQISCFLVQFSHCFLLLSLYKQKKHEGSNGQDGWLVANGAMRTIIAPPRLA